MTQKTKKVTVEREVYIACDGAEFDDENDCRAYEVGLVEKSFEMYDCHLAKDENLDSCCYVRLTSNEDVERFIDCCNYYGICSDGIYYPGIYAYSEATSRYGAWVNLNEVMSAFGLNIVESEETKC